MMYSPLLFIMGGKLPHAPSIEVPGANRYIGGGIARFTRVLFELPCYLQFEQEIHIVEVSYFTNILIK